MPRRWGQHYLRYRRIARHMVNWADFSPDRPVLEIGPGPGMLTSVLLERGYEVVAVEIDPRWVQRLQQRWDNAQLHVVHGDILRMDWPRVLPPRVTRAGPFGIIGNIPYQISSPLVGRLMRYRTFWYRVVWMVQREFGERLTAQPGTSNYGALSVLVQLMWNVQAGLRIAPGAFRPPPRVESILVRIDPRPRVHSAVWTEDFQRFIRAAFRHRRKTLVNSLRANLTEAQMERLIDALTHFGWPLQVRAEQIAPADWLRLWAWVRQV